MVDIMRKVRLMRLNALQKLTEFTYRRFSTQLQELQDTKLDLRGSYLHHVGETPLVYRTLGEHLAIAAEKYCDNEAIVSCNEDRRLTFAEVLEEADRLAAGLVRLGLKHGDRLGIWAPNNIEWYVSMMAAARAGLILVGINPAYQVPELEYCLKKVGIHTVIALEKYKTQNYYEMLSRVLPEMKTSEPGKIKNKNLPNLKTVVIDTENDLPGVLKYKELMSLASDTEVKSIAKYQHDIQPDWGCNMQFTSGTTGQPKAALLSHYSFVNNGIHIGARNELGFSSQRICTQVPLFHAYGAVIGIATAMSYGATLVLPGLGFKPENSLRAIEKEKCTVIYGTPTMYVDLIAKQRELNVNIKSAKIAVTGGASCSPQLFTSMLETLGVEKVKTVFGMTEATAVIFQSLYTENKQQVLETVGHLQDHIEAKVVDTNNNIVPYGQPGELCVRGYLTMLGYWDDLAKTREMIGSDKWLKTGDQFILQEDGYGRIVGRLKEMIIRGGENIYPKEIEDYLNSHPDILETHVIGVPDERMGEEICAFVRLQNRDEITIQEIRKFCTGSIAHFKIPRYVHVVKAMPKTTSGKIQKFKLRQLYDEMHK